MNRLSIALIALAMVAAVVTPAAAQPAAAPDPGAAFAPDPGPAPGPKAGGALSSTPGSANPYLAFLPSEVEPDFAYWNAQAAEEAQAASAAQSIQAVIAVSEAEPVGMVGQNDTPGAAEAVGAVPAGDDLEITGSLGVTPTTLPLAGDVGDHIAAATDLAPSLPAGSAVLLDEVTIGDGPHGSGGDATNDFDFYKITVVAGDTIDIDTNTVDPFGPLDPVLGLYDAAGTLIAFNDDDGATFDSRIAGTFLVSGDFYIAVGGFAGFGPGATLPSDPTTPGTGPGGGSEGLYDLQVSRAANDVDIFAVDLQAGDVLHAYTNGAAGRVEILDPAEALQVGTSFNSVAFIFPDDSPFKGLGGDLAVTTVAETTGTYYLAAAGGIGAYTLSLAVRRPGLEQRPGSDQQIIFVDFDGGTVNPSIWGGPNENRTISPLSSFLANWGLSDESSLIDRILDVLVESLSTDLRVLNHAGDRDASGTPGEFDVEILNSRDHADPFGDPNVSRLFVGGTIPEIGISTIGIAQTIDIGNYDQTESAITLLDLLSAPAVDPNSLNQFADGGDKEGLVAEGVGNITAHEAGHLLGNFHTDNLNAPGSVMDQGGFLANIVGIGPDLTFGTPDDIDVHLDEDDYVPNEGFQGTEDTAVHTSWGMTTGMSAVAETCEGLTATITGAGIITGTEGDDVIVGSAGDDTINGLGGDDTICAGPGNDTVNGGNGKDTIRGQAGDDILDGGNQDDDVHGNDGNDEVYGGQHDDIVRGGLGDDIVLGQGSRDLVEGGPGNDYLHGNQGGDTVNGGDGDDTILGGQGYDRLIGDAGNDTIDGGPDNDTIRGEDGDDTLNGGDGDDRLFGGPDTDICNGDAGSDQIAGSCETAIP